MSLSCWQQSGCQEFALFIDAVPFTGDLVFNNCHSNISFLNPFRSATVAILNIYQHCSCVRWWGCNFLVIKDLQDTVRLYKGLIWLNREEGEIWSQKLFLNPNWGLSSPGKMGTQSWTHSFSSFPVWATVIGAWDARDSFAKETKVSP